MCRHIHSFLQSAFVYSLLVLASISVFEIAIRFLIEDSETSFGRIFGTELPPLTPVPKQIPPESDRDQWFNEILVGGKKITIGDLWGIHMDDQVLGYKPAPNATSRNGWWRSNNVGAISKLETSKQVPHGKIRVLIFGDSFAQGSRVPFEESWPAVLQSLRDSLEVVNFGVDGYNMAQSFLRYQIVSKSIEFNAVILLFVPAADLWRDINTFRDLVHDWNLFNIMPRYIVERNALRLVTSPYADRTEFLKNNVGGFSADARMHLSLYDRFYFASCYETPILFGHLISFKVVYQYVCNNQKKELLGSTYDSHREALQVSRRIFEAMNESVERSGGSFNLMILPSRMDIKRFRENPKSIKRWSNMISFFCDAKFKCLDLSIIFEGMAFDQIDSGYDQSHYGPLIHRSIAEKVAKHLSFN